ncbi:MAG: hypothetical protein IKG39_11960 [Lachnospiraceae bacterium]|nr:hypothetical protein [Lachnospiraceae bacterium]
MGFRIGSFNVRNLSKNNGENLNIIAQIISREKFDIIALQEVLDRGKILDGGMGRSVKGEAAAYQDCLLRRLPGYAMRWGASNVKSKSADENGDKRGEGYAFIWNTRRVELAKQITPSGERVFNPRIWGQYSLRRADGVRRLVRDPFYARFKIKGMKQEIRLITTHIYFGSNNSMDLDLRKRELNILAGAIYPRLHDKTYGVNTPATTILIGDYNLNLKDSLAGSSYMDAVIIVDENGVVRSAAEMRMDGNIRTFSTHQNQLSTLSRTGAEEKYSNNYDHITYETSLGGRNNAHDGDSLSNPHAIRVSDLPLNIDFETYRSKVSDHLPICVELTFRN